MAFLGGQGVEWYYFGFDRLPRLRSSNNGSKSYVMVEDEDEGSVNGEKVEMEMSRERRVQGVRALVGGIGFAMGVVGIWGDGA
jgi:autophagy-related protein 33